VRRDPPVHVVLGTRQRLALRFDPATVRLHLPNGVLGSYLLLSGRNAIYIGRSDTCLRRRLESHPLLGTATHVAWEAAASPERAFLAEAFWFHELRRVGHTLNIAHPARPAGSTRACPFCAGQAAERRALMCALPDTPTAWYETPLAA
jgi:hypothetical protein